MATAFSDEEKLFFIEFLGALGHWHGTEAIVGTKFVAYNCLKYSHFPLIGAKGPGPNHGKQPQIHTYIGTSCVQHSTY